MSKAWIYLAKVVRVGPGGKELVDAVLVTANQINDNPDFSQLRESKAYRNRLEQICIIFLDIFMRSHSVNKPQYFCCKMCLKPIVQVYTGE